LQVTCASMAGFALNSSIFRISVVHPSRSAFSCFHQHIIRLVCVCVAWVLKPWAKPFSKSKGDDP
jgi:hypothetical protein